MTPELRRRLINAMPELRRSAHSTVLDDILAELDAAGYQIVPKYPTAEMLEGRPHQASPGSIYRAMVAAAKKATK
jgi:hypothetical protein